MAGWSKGPHCSSSLAPPTEAGVLPNGTRCRTLLEASGAVRRKGFGPEKVGGPRPTINISPKKRSSRGLSFDRSDRHALSFRPTPPCNPLTTVVHFSPNFVRLQPYETIFPYLGAALFLSSSKRTSTESETHLALDSAPRST